MAKKTKFSSQQAMSLPIFLSYSATALRYGDLGRTVLQCLHDIHSMERALSIFQSALAYGNLENVSPLTTSPLQSLSSFDAHVGDCACQTRAQMLWDLVMFYRKADNNLILSFAIGRLKKIKLNTALLLEEIELNHGKPRHPSLSVLVNYNAIWERIDFNSFLDLVPMADVVSSTESTVPLTTNTGAQRYSNRRGDLAVDAAWKPHDINSIARFLAMCNLMSEFKIATIEAGSPTRIKVCVDLRLIYEKNARELEELQLIPNKNQNYRIKANGRMTRQVEAMQVYVSRVTTDWVRQTAIKDPHFRVGQSFPEEFVATSERRITCVSSYLSFLLVQAAWIKYDIPIFAVIQHFCSHGGYHNIYCRVLKNPMGKTSRNYFSTISENDWFRTEIVSLDQVSSSSWGRTPHIIMVGMSCEGGINNFIQSLLESQRGLLPLEHHCGQADDCALAITYTNIPRLLAQDFAQHDQFPFHLKDQFSRVAGALGRSLGKETEVAFADARVWADKFGTGESTWLGIEHIFLEYPGVLAKYLAEYGETPGVFGCQLK
ncbi:hypothetical protein CPB83DRAFT_862130 [Crepidotus variabilis]|uniref:Uncharacterized protein n=1 Tax=Crepidotus variabilis TaxID=179855 RepID=A0A9P6E7I6_9AGAR|nr:hypothetical protein CPB83DRAFT_862130 [Crepidotus variabilis]